MWEGGRPERTAALWKVPEEEHDYATWSNAINIRRIFFVLLVFLLIMTIYLGSSLYIMVAEDVAQVRTAILTATLLMIAVALGGAFYALVYPRYSSKPGRGRLR